MDSHTDDDVVDELVAAPVRLRYTGTLLLLACLALELWIAYRPPRWLLVEFDAATASSSSNGHAADAVDRVKAYTAAGE